MPPKPLKQLQSQHFIAIELKSKGWKQIEIAKHLKVSKITVYRWFQDPMVQAEMERIQGAALADALETLRASAQAAARYLASASDLRDPDHKKTNSTGVRAATAILDRVGLKEEIAKEMEQKEDILDLEAIRTILRSVPPRVLEALREDAG